MASILIVDDNADACEMAAHRLGKLGHHTECAKNGREAMNGILNRTPDLVVLDLLMPEMDGVNLLEVIRSYLRLQSLPVVVWTAIEDESRLSRARSLHVNGILLKGEAGVDELAIKVSYELEHLAISQASAIHSQAHPSSATGHP
jgi:CheY-like chemotaxis protein